MRTGSLPPLPDPGYTGWRLLLVVLLWATACGEGLPPSPAARAEFRRHLHQGLDQMRNVLLEAAEAEFRQCERIDPENLDLRFHWARLQLSDPGGEREKALATLRELTGEEPGTIRSARVLMDDFERSGNRVMAQDLRKGILERYGDLGALELAETRALQGDSRERVSLGRKTIPEIRAAAETGTLTDADRFIMNVWRLGGLVLLYDPEPAMEELGRMFQRYPDLPALRIRVANHLRLSRYPRPATNRRTATDSQWSLEVAQLQYERALDLLPADSPLALVAQYRLGTLALEMGDFDEAKKKFDLVAAHPEVKDPDRLRSHWLRGVAEYRQGRFREAVASTQKAVRIRPEVQALWSLRLALERSGGSGTSVFPLRPDTVQPANPTGLKFRDVAGSLGVDKVDGAGPSAWGDYDNDGDFDLFVAGCDTFSILYRNDGNRFTDVSREAGLELIEPGWSSTFADYDNDGDPDLYVARNGWNGPGKNSLYENLGDGTFTDVTGRAGLGDPGSTFVHAWADFDGDGFLDLFVANGVRLDGSVNRLYQNNGDGTFTDVTEKTGLLEPAGTQTIGFAVGDYDRDGWPDLFVNGYRLEWNRLYHNRGDGTFEEVADRAGVRGNRKKAQGYVALFFDYNNDAWPDILLTKLASWTRTLIGMSKWYLDQPSEVREEFLDLAPELYRNNGDGTFTNVSRAAGFRYPHGVMGAGVADLDNDGFLDVYFGTGAPQLQRLEPNIFYRNSGKGGFVDLTWVTGLGHLGKGHGITFSDFDRNGTLDIYAPQGGFVHGDLWPNAFYRNDTENGYHWLQLRLQGTRSNRDAVGAQVTLSAGPLTLYREVTSGGAFGVSDEPVLHFGLGKETVVEKLEVRWPSGLRQSFPWVGVGTRFLLKEAGGLQEIFTEEN